MPETVPKRGIQNPAKHVKWSRKESLAKINFGLELFPKDIKDMHFLSFFYRM